MGARGYSQEYKVTYSTFVVIIGDASGTEYVRYKIKSNIETLDLNGDNTLSIIGRPSTIEVKSYFLDVDEFGNKITECGQDIQIINLPNFECFSYSNLNFTTTCSVDVSIEIEVTPVLIFEASTSPENDVSNSIPYCITDPIRLVATPSFLTYNWQYQIDGQNWSGFNPGTGNDVSFSLVDILGDQAISNINKSVFFRYSVGNCTNSWATTQSGYKFSILPPEVTGVNKFDPTCNGGNNGGVSSTVLNRTLETGESFLYDLFDHTDKNIGSNNVGIFDNLSAGSYTLSIQPLSFSYCNTLGSIHSFQIGNPPPITYSTSTIQPVRCFNTGTGVINFTASGGSGSGYNYLINNTQVTNTPVFSNLIEGDHTISILDGLGCRKDTVIYMPGPIKALYADIYLSSDFNGSPLSCATSSDATVDVVGKEGWGSYTYSDSEFGTYISSGAFGNLAAGTQTFWIKDSEGCTISSSLIITPPVELSISDFLVTAPKCVGEAGSISIIPSGGTGTIQYSIDNIIFQLTPLFYAFAGTYYIYLRDDNGCTIVSSEVLVQDPTPVAYSTSISQVSCNGGSDAAISILNAINGILPYEYSINGGVYSSLNTFSNLSAGDYSISIKDGNGCISSSSHTINEPIVISGLILETPILCNGESNGALSVTGNGGSGGYTYLWSNGQSTNIISNLPAGNYNVSITDQNGCLSDLQTYSITEPEDILITPINNVVNGYDVSCFGANDGIVDLAVTGGSISSDYLYEWSNGQTNSTLVNAPAGSYSVKVTDDNGCFAEINIEVEEPPELVISELLVGNVSCFQGTDGTLQVTASGGIGDYEYSIDGGAYEIISSFDSLSPGDHIISVMDLNNCYQTALLTISAPEKISINLLGSSSTICGQANGMVDISVIGGVAPYRFNWTDNLGESIGNLEDLSDVASGAYNLLITDSNGCTQLYSSTVSNSDGPTVQVDSIVGTSCFDSADGKATLSVVGGLPPYEIVWGNGEVGLNALNLIKGSVDVSIKDDAGCISFLTLDIPGKEELKIVDLQLDPPLCFGGSDGRIPINVAGGTAPYVYYWSNGESGSSLSGLSAGNYVLTIVDDNKCKISMSIDLIQPEAISINMDVNHPSCATTNDGSVSLIVAGGTSPYNIYLDSLEQPSDFIQSLASGLYTVMVEDINGCAETSTIEIPDAEPWLIFLEDLVICEGQEIDLFAPVEAEFFSWYHQNELISVANNITVSQPGDYSLEVVNASGCNGKGGFFVSTSNDVLISDFLISSQAYVGDTVIMIDITYPIPDSIEWDIPSSVEVIEATRDLALVIFNSPGNYNIEVEAYLGYCVDYYSSSIEILEVAGSSVNGRFATDSDPIIKSLEVYPNPNEGNFKIESIFKESKSATIKLINLQTNKIVLEQLSSNNIEHSFQLDLPNLAPGVYAVVIEISDEVKVVRMIKH